MKKLVLLFITTLILGGLFAVPLYEGFESTTCPATGWTITYANQSFPSGNTMTHSTTYSYAGARSFRFSSYSSGAPYDQYLITPELDVTAGDQTVSFWYRKHTYGSEVFRVGWSSTGTGDADFTWSTDITDASTTWQQYIKTDLPVGTKYVAIHYKSSYAYYLYIDEFVGPNVNVAPEPSSHVTGFTATPGYFDVKLDWTGSTGTQLPHRYLIQAIKVGAGSYAAVADGTPVADDTDWSDGNAAVNVAHVVGANTYTFTGLNPITAYEFKIWPYTNSGTDIDFKVDTPIPTISATTLDPTIYAADLPYLQDFDAVTAPALPAGWSKQVSSTSSYAAVETYTSGTPNSAPNHARLANSGDSAADLVLISPLIDPNLSSLKVKFWAKGGTNYTLQVGTMDGAGSRAVFTNVETINLTSTYTEYSVSFIGYTGTDQHIAFKHGLGSTYRTIYIDDVTIELLPTSGVLQVTPDPVECGNGYVGFEKDVTVTLANIGGAPFDISAGGITLSDYTNFQLDNLPTLPYTLQPNTSVQITVVFTPTVTGDLTTNLLINDTRQASSIVVNGTGVQPLVGEICENPYLATLPLVDYAGTTAGYANDYTSEMFTELGNTNYVRGQDWVAKITIPGNGLLDISLADQTGYNYQYMGVFLVNTIPSIANPAAVLAQAYGTSTPLNIADAVVSAGDYYVIVDNWPSPYDVYFVLNISFEPVTSAPNPATLVSPANGATDVPLTQTLNWSSGGGFVEGYRLSFGTVTPYTTIVNNVDLGMDTTYTPTLNYSTEYWWTVTPYNTDFGDASPITEWTFTTRDDPTIYAPWLEDFGTTGTNFPPMNWTRWSGLLTQDPVTLTSASGYWVQDDFANIVTSPTNKSARINIYGATTIRHWLMTPPIQMPGTGYQLEFDIALTDYNYAEPITSDPNGTTGVDDRFVVLISDGNSWSTANAVKIWDNDDQTSGGIYEVYNDVPHTGAHYILPLDNYTGIQYIAFYGESTASNADNDFFVDNVLIRETPVAAVFTIAPAITSWDFGMVPVGGSAEKEFAVTNTGPGNLIVSSITQTGTNPPFSIVPTPALPWSLTSADPANTFKVVFTPQTAGGPFTTDVTVTYNNGAQATYTISFTGSAYLPATLPLTEGWENGQGNWIIVNGTQTNKWHIGAGDATYGPYEGNNFAYISNDEGTTVAYTTNSASVTHIYTDIAFDEDCMEFPLSFQWRCRGEGTAWDRMRVYLVDTSVTPVAGAELTTGQVGLANYNLQTAWTAATITLPGSLSGTLKRLVFSWRNDSSSGSQPPANIDNISLTAVPNPTGPVVAPNLDYPADRQTDLPKTGFSFQFSWNIAGSEPDTYNLYLANLADLDPGYSSDDFFAAAIPYEDISSPYRPSFTYVYGETYVWTVSGSNAAYPDEVYQWPPYEFTIEPDPTIILPHTQNFGTDATPVWPLGWTQTYSGGVISDRWTVSASTNAGGTANEMKCSWYDAIGVSRLITPPIDTNGIPMFTASFNHYYNDFGAGVTAKLQYSHDLNTWYDTGYAIISGSGSFGAYETVTISGLNAPVTYLAWVMDGNHYQFNYWYVDDVYLAVPHNLDAKAVSIDMYQVVEPLAFTPMATVGNNGTQTISFNVTMTIGGTTLPAQSVTALAPEATQQLSFGSFTPVANTFYDVTVTTNLAGDEDPANDTIAGQFVCIELNKTAYGDVCFDPGNILDGPATFSLRNPGAITDLAPGNPYTNPDSWLTAADWINGGWWGTDYNGNDWWQIDTTTGAGTDNGDVGIGMTGVAWDPVADILYGVSYDGVNYVNNLYTLDRLTGAPTLVGTLTWDGTAFDGLIIDIAWNNNNGTLYGLDLGYDAVFTIDPATLAITPLGYTVGYDLNYAQGMAFDQDTGFLYLAAYAGAGALMWVNTVQPDADGLLGEAYVIGIFQNNSEVDGFVIPYPQLAIPDLTIALESGVPTLSWNSIVGATAYKVYGSSDPYADDPWTLVATTASTTYAYTGTEPYHFFKVTAIDGPAPARTQFTGIERVRQVMQPTKVQSIRAKGPKAAEMGAFNPIKK